MAGAIFLTAIAVLPDLLYFYFGIPYTIALFFGGTGTLIAVGVVLETMKQIEGQLLQRNYDGFLKRMKSHSGHAQLSQISGEIPTQLKFLFGVVCALFFVGLITWGVNSYL